MLLSNIHESSVYFTRYLEYPKVIPTPVVEGILISQLPSLLLIGEQQSEI